MLFQEEVVHAEVCSPGLDVLCGPVTLKGTNILLFQDEVVHAEVCTPGLDVQCGPVTLKGTKIGSRQKCVDITRTVCSEGVGKNFIKFIQNVFFICFRFY